MRYSLHAALYSAGLDPSYDKAFIGSKATRVRFGDVVGTKPLYGRWYRLICVSSTILILRIGLKLLT